MEATAPGKSSMVIPRRNSRALADAVIDFYDHPEKREEFGEYGLNFVKDHYEINKCFEAVEQYYYDFLKK